jgi:hypothetical protein
MIKNNPMTINEIIEKFGCASNTARNWVRHEQVEKVEGSYPPRYVRKDTLDLGTKINKPPVVRDASKPGKVTIEIDVPPQEEVEAFFRKILAAEGGQLDFVKEFRAVDSQKSALYLLHKLKSAIVVTEYYVALMKSDGIE